MCNTLGGERLEPKQANTVKEKEMRKIICMTNKQEARRVVGSSRGKEEKTRQHSYEEKKTHR
jgi:hypothetical protein